MSFKALLFVQDKCEPCHRTLASLNDAFDQSPYIEITPYKDSEGNKTEQAESYNVTVTPTIVVLHPSGTELGRFKGSSQMPSAFFSKLARFLNTANDDKERKDLT